MPAPVAAVGGTIPFSTSLPSWATVTPYPEARAIGACCSELSLGAARTPRAAAAAASRIYGCACAAPWSFVPCVARLANVLACLCVADGPLGLF
jgi:hypothetical protein